MVRFMHTAYVYTDSVSNVLRFRKACGSNSIQPAQAICLRSPHGGMHWNSTQPQPVGQGVSQIPQWLGSERVSIQSSPQLPKPLLQMTAQAPSVQFGVPCNVRGEGQTFPQRPQLLTSPLRFTQRPLHIVYGGAQLYVHEPETHCGMAFGSLDEQTSQRGPHASTRVGSTHAPLQSWREPEQRHTPA